MTSIYHLPDLSVIDVHGADSAAILHNITTNAVKTLADGEGCETFITEVRGKTLGHGYLFRTVDGFRYVGAKNQSEVIAQHMDKYTIREDAVPTIVDDQFQGLVIPPEQVSVLEIALPDSETPVCWHQDFAGQEMMMCRVDFLGASTVMVLVPTAVFDSVCGSLAEKDIAVLPEPDFHRARVLAGFPWYGIDLDEKNLPQEADRDPSAVSFTKGCYLGQETVARLDALGQVQRKLVKWSIAGSVPAPGSTLDCDGKTVGRLTSIVDSGEKTPSGAMALGYARRSHFEPGMTGEGVDAATGEAFVATVVGSGT